MSAATSDSTPTADADGDADPASDTALTPASAEEIPDLRVEIDAIDAEILRLIQRRSEISQRIGLARMAAGGPRIVYNREMAVLARFRALGAEGRELGMLLLRLGRGRLGGRS
ncbi:chorismate mutase [Actinomycetospora lutea]|uniref:chorismate mutase n=1 Tax=Actinomycetospora lutea TaxID=663604 RepID=UPI002366ED87|nr:chorismate mutase [Actinomycetospora lutea]MDD7938617.1 chorismate mutase [Actinomycetospora lutea]